MYAHGILDNIEREVERELGVKLVIHLDPVETDDAALNQVREKLDAGVREIDPCLSIHDLRMARTHDHTNLFFDVAVPSDYRADSDQLRRFVEQKVREIDPSYYPVIEIDRNYHASIEE